MNLTTLKTEAMKLEPADIESLTLFLVAHLEEETHHATKEIEALWYQEAERRFQAYQRGELQSFSSDEVFEEAYREIQ